MLAAAGGIVAVTLADAASFLASAVLLVLVRTNGRTAAREGGPVRGRLAAVGTDLRAGLRLATRHRTLRLLMIFALVTSVGEGIMSTLVTPFVENVLHGTPQDLGFILGYVAVWPAVAGMIVVGLPGALTLAGLITLFQRSSEDSYRGRVLGALSALEGVSVLAGTLGAGYLSRVAGIIPVLAVHGAGYVVAGLVMFRCLREGEEHVNLAPEIGTEKPVAACPGTA